MNQQDPELQKIIWDARVKIVIGRFIIMAFYAFMAVGVTALLLDQFVMGQMGDAFIKPVIMNWGLPITGVALVVGFVTNFLPKQKKITLFTNQLYAHKQAASRVSFPTATIESECFTDVPGLGFRDGVRYRSWKIENQLMFFPVRPSIERLAPYETGTVPFAAIALDIARIVSVERGGVITRTYKAYDEKKKEIAQALNHNTMRLTYGEGPAVAIMFEAGLLALIAPAPEPAPAPAPKAPDAVAPVKAQPVAGNDIEAKLKKLQDLRDKGFISEQEYKERKDKLLDTL